ncbi:MAG: hypothetical protein EA387_04420 [Nitriliruptor sp.]|nr:MAG: hypothetical protein EA387_04420 [Nitriliruptor sp.]
MTGVEERLIEHSPAVHVRRPKFSPESTRLGLDRTELGAFLAQAGLSGGNDHALVYLLALNALRASEACGVDLADLALANGHPVVRVVGTGNQPALIPPAPRTARAIDAAVGERTEAPLLARPDGRRLDRRAAGGSRRDVQDFARHAETRQSRRYDRARGALDRNRTDLVATYLAGATSARQDSASARGCRERRSAAVMLRGLVAGPGRTQLMRHPASR